MSSTESSVKSPTTPPTGLPIDSPIDSPVDSSVDSSTKSPMGPQPKSAAPRSSILVVSDLHLGASLRPPLDSKALEMVDKIDAALAHFLDYHHEHPIYTETGDRLSWTLVFNGDTIDFMHMGLSVAEHIQLEAEEALYGLSFARRRSRWKLQEIAKYHHRAFRALARFIERGNQCVFVVGNHDADLWFEKVRRDLRSLISRHTKHPKAAKRAIHFAPWFYYEEGRIYIEHGHRFDAYSTFPDPLRPVDVESGQMKPTFGHWGLRYFCNPVPTFPIHDLDDWNTLDFIRWAWTKAGVGLVSLVTFYLGFLWRYLKDTAEARVRRRSGSTEARLKRRSRRLSRFARRHKLNLNRIRALDQLREDHVGESLGRLALATHFDKLILVIGSGFGIIGLLSYTQGWVMWLGLGLGSALLGLAWVGLARIRPNHDPHPQMASVAARIGEITDVPLVVLGHTHRPTLEQQGQVNWLNPGSWEHLPRAPKHAPDAPCTCVAKFGVVSGEGDTLEVGLYQWCSIKRSAEEINHLEGNEQELLGKLAELSDPSG